MFLSGCSEQKQRKLLEVAELRITEGKYPEATEILRKVIAINPDNKLAAKALYKLGFTLEVYGRDPDGAIFNYQEAIRLSQDPASVYEIQKRVANLFFDQSKDIEKAISAYKKLISFNPSSLELDFFQFRIAEAYFRQNNFEQARNEYQKLVETFPKSQYLSKSRFEIGNSYYMEGKYDIAIEAFKQVGRYHPQSEHEVEAEFLMAQCLEQANKPKEALIIYENLKSRYANPQIIDHRLDQLKQRLKKERK